MVQLVSSGKILKCIFLSLKSTVISKIDPSSGEVETEAPLGLTDQSAYAVWKVSGQWKTPSQRRLVAFLKTTLRLSFSLHTETYTHVHMCMRAHTPTHTPPFLTNQKKEDRTKEDIKRRDYVRSHLPKQQPFYVVYTPSDYNTSTHATILILGGRGEHSMSRLWVLQKGCQYQIWGKNTVSFCASKDCPVPRTRSEAPSSLSLFR